MARKQNDQLDLILFQAPAEYYFGEMSLDVQKVFASVQVKWSSRPAVRIGQIL